LNHFIQIGFSQINTVTKEKYGNNEAEVCEKEPELITLKTDFLLLQAELIQDLGSNNEAYNIYLDAFNNGRKIEYYPNSLPYARLLKSLGRIPEAEGFCYRGLHKAIIQN